jgi:hypothetical protein
VRKEGGSGPAGLDGRKWRYGPLRGGKRKGMGWACWARMKKRRVWFFFSFSFLFNPLLKNLSSFSKKLFKPHNQTKAHAFNMMHKHLYIF